MHARWVVVGAAAFAVVALYAATRSTVPVAAQDGDVLGPDTAESARGLLPDEILEHYRRGDYRNRVVVLGPEGRARIANPPDFQAASQANRGRYALDPRGSIVEVATGRPPAHVMGLPFPDVDAADPDAGTKIVWNYFYGQYYRGDSHFLTELVMLGGRGFERRLSIDVYTRLYDGSPESRGRANPHDLFLQQIATVVAPTDMHGTISLSWRSREADRPDSVWTYVPGLRRVRQVSPLNRSDGFLGSDLSQDDGPYFDGKPEDFAFRLVGRQDQLMLLDPFGLAGDVELVQLPEAGWRIVWKDVPRIGADDPSWTGLPWAPVSAVLVRRPAWVVEALPRDPHYLYGRVLLRFDAETYRGSWSSKYDRAGTLVLSYQVSNGAYVSPDGGRTYVEAGGITVQTAENLIYQRATVNLFPPRNPQSPADWRVVPPADLFDPDVLVRIGE